MRNRRDPSHEPVSRSERSALARLQQFIALATVLWVAVWWLWVWNRSPVWALAGAAVVVLGYAAVLALEFVIVARVNRSDATPRASNWTLVRAWWGEVCVAPQVFSWRQPFRWRRLPDDEPGSRPLSSGSPAVVLIHGFVCNRGFWQPWMRELRRRGIPYTSVNLEPVFGSIDDYIPLVDEAVRRARRLSAQPPVLVCHSMGGLAARAWLASRLEQAPGVGMVVTIGTPHRGTWLGRFSHVTSGRQMSIGSAWLRELERQEAGAPNKTRLVCWYSNADNIVFPASTATMPGADNRHVHGIAHVSLAFHPEVVQGTLALIESVEGSGT